MFGGKRGGAQDKDEGNPGQSGGQAVPIDRLALVFAGRGGTAEEDSGKNEQNSMIMIANSKLYASSKFKMARYLRGERSGDHFNLGFGEFLDVFLVGGAVGLVELKWVLLGGAFDVGLVLQQFLDAQEDGLDGDVGLPVLLVVEDGEADRARGVDVGVGQDGIEDALGGSVWGRGT